MLSSWRCHRLLRASPLLRRASATADSPLVRLGRQPRHRSPVVMTNCRSIRTAQSSYPWYNSPPIFHGELELTRKEYFSFLSSSGRKNSNNDDEYQSQWKERPSPSSVNVDTFQDRDIRELHVMTDRLLQWYEEQSQQASSSNFYFLENDDDGRKQKRVKYLLEDTEMTIRWWTTLRTAESVQQSFALFQALVDFLPRIIPEEDLNDDANDDDDDEDYYEDEDGVVDAPMWIVWLTGRHTFPLATHVLNAMLDSWRIASTRIDKTTTNQEEGSLESVLPTPREMLDRVMQWQMKQGIPVDKRTFNIIMLAAIEAIPKDGDEQQLQKQREELPLFCEQILDLMLELGTAAATKTDPGEANSSYPPWFDHLFTLHIRPNVISFTTALNAWANSGRPDSAKRARKLFDALLQFEEDGLLLEARNDYTTEDGSDDWHVDTNANAKPSIITYNTYLKVLASTHQTSDMIEAERVLQDMLINIGVDTVSFRTVMTGWLALDNIPRAYALLIRMVELYEAGHEDMNVDATYFSRFIFLLSKNKGLSKEQIRKRTQLAMQIYEQLIALYHKTNDPRFEPEVMTFRSMIMLHASQGRPEEAETLLTKLEEMATITNDANMLPSHGHYGDVLFAWSDSQLPHAAERAEKLLYRWIQAEIIRSKHRNNNPGDDANQNNQHRNIVDGRVVEVVFNLWAESRQDDACERAEALLRNLQKINNSIGRQPEAVGIVTGHYLSVMLCWSRSGRSNGAEKAEIILAELLQHHDRDPTFHPTCFHFTTAIEAWAYSGDRNGWQRAKRIFDEALARATPGNRDSIPDHKLYSSLINACARNWQPEKAEETLLQMLRDRDNGNILLKPSTADFNLVIKSWVRSKKPNAQMRCQALVSLMQERGIRLDKKTLESLEKVALYPRDK